MDGSKPREESRKAKGHRLEAVAARYLQSRGIRVIEQNVFSRGGEIDLIGKDGETLVFFEVRYRGNGSLTGGAESITYAKQRKLVRAVSYYLHRHGLWNVDCRIDVIAIAPGILKKYRVQWLKNAIQS